MDSETKLKKLLKDKGYSITKPRLIVFSFLQNMDGPVSVAELAKSLQDIDKVSIYRTIDLFESAGIIHRVWTGFKSRVELSEEFSEHHHHFTCVNCGKIISFDSAALEKSLTSLEKSKGLELTHHSVELTGYCQACRG